MLPDRTAARLLSAHGRVSASTARTTERTAEPIRKQLSALSRARLWARSVSLLAGCLGLAVGISGLLHAGLGIGPYDVLLGGLADTFHVSFGLVAAVLGTVLLAVGRALGARIGAGTVVVVVLVGPAVDGVGTLMAPASGVLVGGAMASVGVVVLALSVATIVATRLGGGPVEVLTMGLRARGVPLAPARTGIDVAACLAGWALGGQVGAFTLVVALGLGRALSALLPSELTAVDEVAVDEAERARGTWTTLHTDCPPASSWCDWLAVADTGPGCDQIRLATA